MKTAMPQQLELGDRFRRGRSYLHDISPKETHNAKGLDAETGYSGRTTGRSDGAAAALVVLIILLKAAILLFRAETYGRPPIPPVYADVTYFVYGREPVTAFKAAHHPPPV